MTKKRISGINASEMPTRVLSLAEDDDKRAAMLTKMDTPGTQFHDLVENLHADDDAALGKAVIGEFDDEELGAKALGLRHYNRLNQRVETAGRLHRTILVAEKALERVMSPSVRYGIKRGHIKK